MTLQIESRREYADAASARSCLSSKDKVMGRRLETAARWSVIPHFISEDRSDLRGIKPGWYAIDRRGQLSSGPFSNREECVARITRPTNDAPAR